MPDSELRNIANGSPAINTIFNKGLYTGAFMSTPEAVNCRPFWGCVNWPVDAHAVRNSAAQMGLTINSNWTAIECTACGAALGSHVAVNPYFIIERLTAQDFAGTAPQFLTDAPRSVILRVTAVGFGKGASGAGNAANTNLGNAMLQSTYILGR